MCCSAALAIVFHFHYKVHCPKDGDDPRRLASFFRLGIYRPMGGMSPAMRDTIGVKPPRSSFRGRGGSPEAALSPPWQNATAALTGVRDPGASRRLRGNSAGRRRDKPG